jgi:uncharacterized membrane protein (DUF2068 family)
MYMSPRRSRPLGITIIAIVVGIQGIFTIIAGLQFLGTITLILGVLTLLLAWGLWTLQSWAFWTAVVLEVVDIINDLFALRQGASVIPSLIFSALILVYLLRDESVRAAFRT